MSDFLEKLATDAGKGALAGAAFGPIGAGAGALINVALGQAPGLGHLLGGENEAKTEALVAQVTGTLDPAEAQQALDNDPDGIRADLERELAAMASENFKAALGDTGKARDASLAQGAQGSKLAWGAALFSILVTLMWFASMLVHLGLSADDSATLRNLVIGVAGYWIGTSANSVAKDHRLANMLPADLLPKPAAIVPAGDVK